MIEKQFWWCGWEEPRSIPPIAVAEKWPDNMQGWLTGSADTYTAWTGAVWAESADAAWETILSCFKSPHCGLIRKRWEPSPRGQDMETSDRFEDPRLDALKGEQKRGFQFL
jgi:hypothetical protein